MLCRMRIAGLWWLVHDICSATIAPRQLIVLWNNPNNQACISIISPTSSIILTNPKPQTFGIDPVPISWGHPDPLIRGPVICTVRHYNQRNAIGAHSGSYCIYTGLAVAAGKLSPDYVPNLKLTSPVFKIGPYPSWNDPKKIASIDPFGHLTTEAYGAYLDKGFDIRPTIAVTKAHIDLPECREAVRAGRLKPDGKILMENGQSVVWKAAIEPVSVVVVL